MDIVLRDLKARVTEELREGYDITAVDDPLFGEGMTVAVNACGLHTSALVVFVKHMIAGAFRELLTEDITEQVIII